MTVVRLLTVGVVIGGCMFVIWQGVSIARFRLAESTSTNANRAEAVQPWIAASGIASRAREDLVASLTNPTGIKGIQNRIADLDSLLSVKPISPTHWLSLSYMRHLALGSVKGVVDALVMARVTGPNEGSIMFQRGILGLVLWESIPPDLQNRSVSDIATVSTTDSELAKPAILRAVLSLKPVRTRQEIRDMFQRNGSFLPDSLGEMTRPNGSSAPKN